jgi:endonuclease G
VRRPSLRLAAALTLSLAALGASGCGLERLLAREEPSRTEAPRHGKHRNRKPRGHGGAASAVPASPPASPPAAPQPAPPGTPSIHLALGTPTDADPSDDHLMVRPQYALSYNPRRLGPNWVSWELNAGYYGGQRRHKGHFLTDESLPAGWYRVHHDDYANTEFDRGHMVRSEERTRSREDNEATFLLTNILPQRHDLNGGPWLRLEEYCQQLAQHGHKEMFLTAGPIFGPTVPTIGHGVAVPEAFYKIVVVLEAGQGPGDVAEQTRVIAVLMPNAVGILEQPWGRYRTSVAEIERRSGYHFLGRVPEGVRTVLEGRVDSGPTG